MLFKFNITNMSKHKNRFSILGCAIFLAFLPIEKTFGFSLSSLQNLPGFSVNVLKLTPDAEKLGVTQEKLREVLVKHLQEAGLPVVSEEKSSSLPGKPILELTVILRKVRDGSSYIFSINLALQKMVSLERPTDNLAGIYAPTWEKTILGMTNKKYYIEVGTRQLLDRFAQEYKVENL